VRLIAGRGSRVAGRITGFADETSLFSSFRSTVSLETCIFTIRRPNLLWLDRAIMSDTIRVSTRRPSSSSLETNRGDGTDGRRCVDPFLLPEGSFGGASPPVIEGGKLGCLRFFGRAARAGPVRSRLFHRVLIKTTARQRGRGSTHPSPSFRSIAVGARRPGRWRRRRNGRTLIFYSILVVAASSLIDPKGST
jgi:hypothetical protein